MNYQIAWTMIIILITAVVFYGLGISAGQRTLLRNRRAARAISEQARRSGS